MIKRGAVALAAALVAVAPIAMASDSANARHRAAARTAASEMLALLKLPPGATRTSADPTRSSVLARAPSSPATPNLIDQHAFWRAPGPPNAVLRWVDRHTPAGSESNMGGGMASPSGIITSWTGFTFGPIRGVVSYRELIVEVAHARGGGTAVRADAEAVWVLTRPTAERIPAGIGAITITSRRPGQQPSQPRTVTGASLVRRIVAFVDRLPAAQPGIRACPADIGPLVELDFRRTAGAPPRATAVADGSGCGLVTLQIGGRREPTLSGGPRLISWLRSIGAL